MQKLSKSIKICKNCYKTLTATLTATFLMIHSVYLQYSIRQIHSPMVSFNSNSINAVIGNRRPSWSSSYLRLALDCFSNVSEPYAGAEPRSVTTFYNQNWNVHFLSVMRYNGNNCTVNKCFTIVYLCFCNIYILKAILQYRPPKETRLDFGNPPDVAAKFG